MNFSKKILLLVRRVVRDSNIDFEFPENSWKYFFFGYLRNIYADKEIYELFKNKSYYSKAIAENFEQTNSNIRLIQHLCLFELTNYDSNDEKNIINTLIANNNPEQISILTNTINKMNEENIKHISENIIKDLWLNLVILKTDQVNSCEIISNTLRLADLIKNLDDYYTDIIVKIVRCDLSESEIYHVIKFLEKHAEKSPINVCRIFRILSKKTPSYPKESIIAIMKSIHNTCNKETVNTICLEYINKNHLYFKDFIKK